MAGLVVLLLAVSRDAREALRSLSTAAAAVDQRRDGLRLDAALAPKEAGGLVDSFNDLLDRMQSLSTRQRRFLVDVAHELGHALAIMRLRIEDLPPGDLRARLAGDLDRVGGRMTAMLALARLRQGLSTPEEVDLRRLARDVAADRAPLAVEAGCDLRFDADPNVPTVRTDRALLDGILCNLVDNAVAHAGAGATILVHVGTSGTVTVRDTGRGMPIDAADLGADAFRGGDPAGGPAAAGLGLGLALVRESAAAIGAAFEITATPGGGTTVRLVLPAEGPPDPEGGSERRDGPAPLLAAQT
jgi:two-component system, OmpR family, sensor histidine kinase TctE